MAKLKTKLSKNFDWHEFTRDYPLTEPEELERVRFITENILQPLRDKFGPIRIISGALSLEHNEKIGGSHRAAVNFIPLNNNINSVWVGLILDGYPYRKAILEERITNSGRTMWIYIDVPLTKEDKTKKELCAAIENGKTIYYPIERSS